MKALHEELWQSCLQLLKDEINPLPFTNWIVSLRPIKMFEGSFYLEAKDEHFLEKALMYKDLIQHALTETSQVRMKVLIQTAQKDTFLSDTSSFVNILPLEEHASQNEFSTQSFKDSGTNTQSFSSSLDREEDLSNSRPFIPETFLAKKDNLQAPSFPYESKPINTANTTTNTLSTGTKTETKGLSFPFSSTFQGFQPSNLFPGKNKKSDFQEHYTFESFVVGDSNRFAHAACLSVAQNTESNKNNPLFIYGGSGLGKTHLMHAIGNYIEKHYPGQNMIYIPCERFVNEFITAIQKNSYDLFRQKYRTCQYLFIDDIQFIEDKDQTQIEFFNTFNELYENGCHIIITCDKPPQNLTKLEERLRTRFSMGLIVDVQAPNYETRVAILEKLAENEHIQMQANVMHFIASHIKTNIRELEGAFNNVVAYSRLSGGEISIDYAKEALKSSINPSMQDKPSADFILTLIANYFNLSKDEILSKNKKKNLAEARQIAMYLLLRYGNMTYGQIGEALGGKHHTTVMHGYEKIKYELENGNTFIIAAVNNLIQRIQGR